MALRAPINVKLLDPNIYIQKNNCLPVTSHQIYEPSSKTFHPEGLFSEVIFGQIGSPNRLYQRGYIELRTKVFQPLVYKTIVSLKGLYGEVLSGKTYAKFDNELNELVRAEMMEPGAGTGYTFFLKYFPKIKFKTTNSLKRKDKLSILEKYKTKLFIDKYLVISAGTRDIREEDTRLSSEDINKLYLGLLSLSQGMPENVEDNAIFDSLKYNIQMKVVQIYEYIENLWTGKKGFAMGKFSARGVALANRNVITSPPISRVLSPDDPKYFKADETLLPLFQVIKGCVPNMIHGLKQIFFDQIFDINSINYSLIDSKTYELKYFSIKDEERALYTTEDGIKKLINLFRNESIRHLPVAIKDNTNTFQYLYLIYDLGDIIYYFRNIVDFKEALLNKPIWSINNIKHLELLDTYKIDKLEAIISGSAAMMAHGYNGSNEDLDITVPKATFDRLIKDYGFTKKPSTKDTPVIEDPTKKLEVMYYSPVANTEYEKLRDMADVIDDYMFDNLEVLNMGYNLSPELRPKDKPKVKWLRNKVFDRKYVRPMTYTEIFYVTAYQIINMSHPPKHCTATRYPILNMYGILPTRINIQTTEPNRTVLLMHPTQNVSYLLPRYPVYKGTFQDSMCVHPSTLESYSGDYDGDTMTAMILLSDEANSELETFRDKPFSFIDSNGRLITGLTNCKIGKYTLYTLSREPEVINYI